MGRGAYLAATRGGTDRAAARAFSDRAQRSYSSQRNNRTGQTNQGTRQSSFDRKSSFWDRGTSGKDNEIRNADGLTQAEVKQMKALADKRNESAYQESLKRQEKMRQAIELQRVTGGNVNPETGGLTDKELEFMRDQGLFAMESSGAMDNFGLEVESNRLKKIINEGGAGYKEALAELTRLHGGNEELAKINALGIQEYINRKTKGDPDAMTDILTGGEIEGLSPDFFKTFAGQTSGVGIGRDKLGDYISGDALGYDEFGTTFFNDADEQFRNDFYTLQNKNAPIDAAYKNLLKNRLGYSSNPYGVGGGGGGYGGYGGYGGGGGSGDGVGGYSFNEYAQQGIAQPPGVGPGTLQEQVSQGFLSGMGAPRFSRGGIVSLLRLGE
jgi:hypothetical protein